MVCLQWETKKLHKKIKSKSYYSSKISSEIIWSCP